MRGNEEDTIRIFIRLKTRIKKTNKKVWDEDLSQNSSFWEGAKILSMSKWNKIVLGATGTAFILLSSGSIPSGKQESGTSGAVQNWKVLSNLLLTQPAKFIFRCMKQQMTTALIFYDSKHFLSS